MKEVVDLTPDPGGDETGREHEQLWEIVYRICERHGVSQKAERAPAPEFGPGKEPL
jgi:hypothetical protein